ncbi:MAG TPA: hypothetical protein VGJ19_01835 [Streptosporangiaceae bacterium]|jgi:hypothetical protein
MASSGRDELSELLRDRQGVVKVAEVLRCRSPAALRWKLESGRWQQPCHGVVVAQSGPLSAPQQLWVAVLWGGRGAVLAGLTAAGLGGLHGFAEPRIHLLVPDTRQIRKEPIRVPIRIPVVAHRSRRLDDADVHPVRLPPRPLLPRSLVDAAAWAATDDHARAVLAAGVQQRLVRPGDLMAVTARSARLRRRQLIQTTLLDVADGAEALSELDLTALLRRYRIPEPDRQASRRTGKAGGAGWMRCGKRPGSSWRSTASGTPTPPPGGRT